MAEEHRCQAPQLCVNNCGFFGSPTTQNLCSKCFRDLQLKEQQHLAFNQTLASSSSSPLTASVSVSSPPTHAPPAKEEREDDVAVTATEKTEAAKPKRCLTCRRRVGLTGFSCRCGMTFCGSHRYPEQHGCTFDFKGMGKDQIARANPVVKADKLQKI